MITRIRHHRRAGRTGALLAALVILGACARPAPAGPGRPSTPPPSPAISGSSPTGSSGGPPDRVAYAALGASETFGFGASTPANGYAQRLEAALHLGPADFIDAGIPGATTAEAGRSEISEALAIRPTICTVFVGVNDVRRGVPLASFQPDLDGMVAALRGAGCRVLVIGLPDLARLPALRSIPAETLDGITRRWNAAMRQIATGRGAGFLDLESLSREIATHPDEIAPDGLHPSDSGHARLAEIILDALRADGYLRG